jgi:glutaconate CoA-transferase subunit B
VTYNAMEQMICCAARLLEDGRTVAVGTGVPCAAAMLAQRTAAPSLVIFFEAGGVGPQLPTMPISVGDSRTFYRALMATSMADVMETCQRGLMDYTFLGGAQIDAYGNLNSTMIGKDYARPKVRLPGSGGASDLASLCWRILVVTNHDRRRFVEKLDFLTTPGYLTGPGAREAAGLPPGTGPYRVITDLAVLGYAEDTKRMQVLSLHPGVTLERVRAHTGFELAVAEPLLTTSPPTEAELIILREEVDPFGYVIGRCAK